MNRLHWMLMVVALLLSACKGGVEDDTGVLVTGQWLQLHLEDPTLMVLHSGTRDMYDSIHIPGARFIDPYAFTVSGGELNNEIPETDSIMGLLRSAGVNRDSEIVLYYDEERLISRTTRVFLALDHAGLGDRTRLLNGGLPGWIAEGREVTDLVPEITEGDPGLPVVRNVTLGAEELELERWNPEYVIIDVRSDDEYYGELDSTGQVPAGGHIEGAYSLNYELLFADSAAYRFKEDAELRALFGKVGLTKGKTAVYYCGTGVRASVSYVVARHLGYDVRLYDGSFQEWDERDLPTISPAVEPSGQNQKP